MRQVLRLTTTGTWRPAVPRPAMIDRAFKKAIYNLLNVRPLYVIHPDSKCQKCFRDKLCGHRHRVCQEIHVAGLVFCWFL